MREIKFRAWDKTNKVWVRIEGFLCENKDGVITHVITDDGLEYEIKYFELARLTGLRDKNGKEIFKSDALSYNIAHNRREIAIVVEGKFGWEFEILNDGFYGDISKKIIRKEWKYIDVCEVFGNTYENPELLK